MNEIVITGQTGSGDNPITGEFIGECDVDGESITIASLQGSIVMGDQPIPTSWADITLKLSEAVSPSVSVRGYACGLVTVSDQTILMGVIACSVNDVPEDPAEAEAWAIAQAQALAECFPDASFELVQLIDFTIDGLPSPEATKVPLAPPCPYGLTHYGEHAYATAEDVAQLLLAKQDVLRMGNRMQLSDNTLSWNDYPADLSFFRRKFGDVVTPFKEYESLYSMACKQPTGVSIALYDASTVKYQLYANRAAAGAPIDDVGGSVLSQSVLAGGFSDWKVYLSEVMLIPTSSTTFLVRGVLDIADISAGEITVSDAIMFQVELSDDDWSVKAGKGYAHRKSGVTVYHPDATEESLEVEVYFTSLATAESDHGE